MLEANFQQKITNSSLIREFVIEGTRQEDRKTISYEILDSPTLPVPATLDAFVIGAIFYVMRAGRPLRVRGNLSRSAMMNLHLFQEAWQNMRPDRYRVVDVIPDSVVDLSPPSAARCLSLFSGGLDSTFTVTRLKQEANYRDRITLTDVLFVQGFDIDPTNRMAFDLATARVAPFLAGLGLKLRRLRTNSKELFDDWENAHGAQSAACLHQFNDYRYGFIPATHPYTASMYPFGSNPATDILLSADEMTILHHGAGYSRVEKVNYLMKFPDALPHLRVCWQGKEQHRNCGTCVKCIQTQMDFWANNLKTIPCFDKPLDEDLIPQLTVKDAGPLNHLKLTLDYAKSRGLGSETWVRKLEARLRLLQFAFQAAEQRALHEINNKKKNESWGFPCIRRFFKKKTR